MTLLPGKVFDVSSVAQQFYNTGSICLSVESKDDVYFPTVTSDTYPTLTYNYTLKIGINSNYSYHTQDIGNAGTFYVNDLTGVINAERTDFAMESEKLPAMCKSVYIQNYNFLTSTLIFNAMNYKWFNYYDQQLKSVIAGNEKQYVWRNGNGEIIEFTDASTKTVGGNTVTFYKDSKKLGYTLYPDNKRIESSDGDVYIFGYSTSSSTFMLDKVSSTEHLDESSGNYTDSIIINHDISGW